ncbi:hypothetical protein GCG54_00015591, partial [Colletotrichum gloeosporioides]
VTGGYYITYVEYRGAKTITIHDVSFSHLWPPLALLARCPPLGANWNLTLKQIQAIHSLRRLGAPIYGFDPETYHPNNKAQQAREIHLLRRLEAPIYLPSSRTIIHSLRSLGAPIYGFETETYHPTKKSQEDSIDHSWPIASFSTPRSFVEVLA